MDILYSQPNYECGTTLDNEPVYSKGYQYNPPQIGGKHAPAKTLNGAFLRIFCVFAQFSGDTNNPNDTNWPVNQMPVWANSFIGTDVNQAPFPINTLSNYFYEMSNGQNIIIGYVYPQLVIVNGTINQSYSISNLSVLQQIDQNTNFQSFDQWSMPGNYQQTFNQTDNYVDAIFIIWRNINYGWGGIAGHGPTYISNEGIKISFPTISATFNIGKNGNYEFQNKLDLFAHEYGHYLFGMTHSFENIYYSTPDATIQRGLGIMNANSGRGLALNPQEKYLLGYITYSDIFYNQTGALPDFNTTGTAYRIPIPTIINGQPNVTPDEFFVIVNHQKLSPYEVRNNKGIYIYHVKSNYFNLNHMDMITADGLWQWQVVNWVPRPNGYGSPASWAWYNSSPPDLFPAIKKTNVDRVNGRDELQEVVFAQYPNQNYYWWDRYLDENGIPNLGVSAEFMKPWSMGYNQIFSPWSNPPSYDKNRNPVYVAMELINNNNGIYNLQFYVGENNSLLTSPSKPQDLRVTVHNTGENAYPKLNWELNLEPDVIASSQGYLIERSLHGGAFTQIATVNGTTSQFIDFGVPWAGGGPNNAAYKIRAKDIQSLTSLYSEIKSIQYGNAWKSGSKEDETFVVTEYNLNQNFPNPFNPQTTIQYDVKEKGFVQLKVYDILGNEVAMLVNEVKESGRYNINFSASELPSGVYIYSLRVNDYFQNRKMTLLK